MKQLPIGESTLANILQQNYLYVDKTEYVHRLVSTNSRYFLSRPRRFGKSLLVDTLKQVFLGNKELFSGLWIGQEGRYDWKSYPVIHLDFSEMDWSSVDALTASLKALLEDIAKSYGVAVDPGVPVTFFSRLVRALAERERVVILVDEYDAPILKNITNLECALAMRDFLSNFYTTVKALDAHLRFVFLTGVSKFSKASVFSGMNNLRDISFSDDFAALCGYTQQELEFCFSGHIEAQAALMQQSRTELLESLRFWYNGYRFSPAPVTVYNPFSILLFFTEKRFDNYWFSTGTPTFLIELVKNKFPDLTAIEEVKVSRKAFDAFEIGTLPLIPLLYQCGYITIREYYPELNNYSFTYPNEEVRRSFFESLIGSMLSENNADANLIFEQLRGAVYEGDVTKLCSSLRNILATIPYNAHIPKEAYYHTILHIVGMGIGRVESEVATSNGRIDLVLHAATAVYIIELKLNKSAQEALDQIKDRRYFEPYIGRGKNVHLIGLSFDFDTKALTWAHEVMA